MPREILPQLTKLDPDYPNRIEIQWGRETSVQVGTSNPDHRGWFVDLDRSDINDLIRILRKARDQAYGADE